jgi:hypothetical protein
MLSGRSIGAGRVRALDGLLDMYPGTCEEKVGKGGGKHTCAEAKALGFHSDCVSRSPTPDLDVTGALDKEERRAGRSGNDLGACFTRCDGGVDK